MSDGDAASTDHGGQRFADYMRQRVEALVSDPKAECRTIVAHDYTALNAINSYLISEQVAPIAVDKLSSVPVLLHQQLADQFESRILCQSQSPFVAGSDTADRVHSRARNQSLAAVMKALYEYHAVASGRVPYQQEQCKLWKQVAIPAADGSLAFEVREVDQIDAGERVVMGCNGVLGMNHATQTTVDFLAQMRRLLGGDTLFDPSSAVQGKPVGLYCLTYPSDHRIRYGQEIPACNASPETYASEPVRHAVERYLLPLLRLDETGDGLLKLTDLKQRMRQFNFFFNSYGTCVGKEIRNVLAETLQQRGYPDQQIRQALSEVYAMNIHPTCRLDDAHPLGTFSSLYVVSKNDRMTPARADYARYVSDKSKTPTLIPISENQLMVWADHPEQGVRWDRLNQNESYDASGVIKEGAIETATVSRGKVGHTLLLATERIVHKTEEGVVISDPAYLAHSLRHAVAATALPKQLVEMMDPIRLCQPKALSASAVWPLPPSYRMMDAIRTFKAAHEKDKGKS